MDEEYLDTKVTKIGDRWHVRLIDTRTGNHIDEMACMYKEDIRYCVFQMLRWHDKCGGTSPMAFRARMRAAFDYPKVTGKIWFQAHLPKKKN